MTFSTFGGANAVPAPPARALLNQTSSVGLPIISEESAGISGITAPPLNPTEQRGRRESFGSTFAGSSGTGGNGGGNESVGLGGFARPAMPTSAYVQD